MADTAVRKIIHVDMGAVFASVEQRDDPSRRRGFDCTSAPLEPRAVYHLSEPAPHEWEDSIAALQRPRWSINFHSLASRS